MGGMAHISSGIVRLDQSTRSVFRGKTPKPSRGDGSASTSSHFPRYGSTSAYTVLPGFESR